MRDDELRRRFHELAEPARRTATPPDPAAIRRRGRARVRRTTTIALAAAAVVVAAAVGTPALSPAARRAVLPDRARPSPPSNRIETRGQGPGVRQPTIGGPVPAGLALRDLSFVSANTGWALGTAPCARQPCTSLVHTSDAGTTWKGGPAPLAWLGDQRGACATRPCVTHLRFANPRVGWAFGPDLFVTRDGGAHWAAEPSPDVLALEAGHGTVVRVVGTPVGDGRDQLAVQVQPVGGGAWTTLATPQLLGGAATLLREGGSDRLYLLVDDHAGQTLLASADWRRWQRLTPPCGAGPVTAAAAAPRGQVALVCGRGTHRVLAVSTTAGATWQARRTLPTGDGGPAALAASGAVLAVTQRDGTVLVSRDRGGTWHATLRGADPGTLGFQDRLTGRVLGAGGTVIWTTTDGGGSWSAYRLPR